MYSNLHNCPARVRYLGHDVLSALVHCTFYRARREDRRNDREDRTFCEIVPRTSTPSEPKREVCHLAHLCVRILEALGPERHWIWVDGSVMQHVPVGRLEVHRNDR